MSLERLKKKIVNNITPVILVIVGVIILVEIYKYDKELSEELGIVSIISVAFVYLTRKITEQFLVRDLEKFKYDLEKEAMKHRVKFEKLHMERAQVIKEIYYKFHDIRNKLRELADKIYKYHENTDEKIESKEYLKYDQEVVALRRNIEKNAIFFHEDLIKEMIEVVASLQNAPTSAHFALGKANDEKSVKFKSEQYFETKQALDGTIFKLLKNEFRKILDAEIDDKKN